MAVPRNWRVAESIKTLIRQVNAAFPGRSRLSDGTIGDPRHQSKESDHNAWIRDRAGRPVVSAVDFTHDPAHGLNSEELAELILASRDPRVKYVISNRKIASGAAGPKPWKWRKYGGSNPHSKHVHLSVSSRQELYDDAREWNLDFGVMSTGDVEVSSSKRLATSEVMPVKKGASDAPPPLGVGSAGIEIEVVQRRLVKLGYYEVGEVDGIWGSRTTAAIAAFKADRGVTGPPVLDAALRVELQAAEGEMQRGSWKRPIDPERAEATTSEVAKRAPEIKPAEEAKKTGFFAAVASFFAAVVAAVGDYFKEALTWLADVKAFFADVPGYVWFGAASVVALYFGWRAARGSELIKRAFNRGERM